MDPVNAIVGGSVSSGLLILAYLLIKNCSCKKFQLHSKCCGASLDAESSEPDIAATPSVNTTVNVRGGPPSPEKKTPRENTAV